MGEKEAVKNANYTGNGLLLILIPKPLRDHLEFLNMLELVDDRSSMSCGVVKYVSILSNQPSHETQRTGWS